MAGFKDAVRSAIKVNFRRIPQRLHDFLSTILPISIVFLTGYMKFYFKGNEKIQCISYSATKEAVNYYIPIVKFHGVETGDPTLAVVKNVFRLLGFRSATASTAVWDVLWSHTYPFHALDKELTSLKSYQKVNHFPGTGFVTQKSNLAKLSVKSVPISFTLPSERESFLSYAEKNTGTFWLMKRRDHRGIHILNGTENLSKNGSFVQEFIRNPFVINKKKFDIGVYVLITSIDPLRVYIYSGDILLRFCTEDYHPLNINSVSSYVVGDNYLPIWKVPDLKFYYSELNYTAKESLNAYVQSKGKSYRRMWTQIHAAVRDVYFKAEEPMKKLAMRLGRLRNYFELVRFDFVADENLNVYLLEVNMSPNLSPAHFPQNKLLYEQIVFNSLSLGGLVRKFPVLAAYRGEVEVSEKDIQVFIEQCASEICQTSCKNLKCKVCSQCLNKEWKDIIKTAYLEHMNRGKYRRAIPAAISSRQQIQNTAEPSEMNLVMDLWFKGKCLQDEAWCQ
ncbi:probable tubulin polyglutamylase ttll-15 [Uloborus diversus]|uniref:probable tubulin polyglutamylase ttll-15 n=1 Tax=Uloborus diversus TaxID=327109 RepID=UPI0024095B04|nr:probable tubulin polyglutamylase ttll-15 [Uloborus diversus]